MATPIRPSEIAKKKVNIPDFVIEVFNELISKNYNGRMAIVNQPEAVREIVKRFNADVDLRYGEKITDHKVFENGWLNVEGIYRKAGWKVEYDKPGYCEDYDAYFTFEKK